MIYNAFTTKAVIVANRNFTKGSNESARIMRFFELLATILLWKYLIVLINLKVYAIGFLPLF